jgi:hypothetical protein
MKFIYFKYLLLLFSTFIVLTGCKKNDEAYQGIIPNVHVDFYLQPDGIDYIPSGKYKYIDYEGYRGIVIYRIDLYTFNAYERTCPYDPQEECARVEVDQSGFILIDSCCMSRYNILDGSPLDGPATLPLKQYTADFVGGTLHVYNGF